MSHDEDLFKKQFAGRTMSWGGVSFVSQTLNEEQLAELKRLHEWELKRREMLLGGLLYRPSMYIGAAEGEPRFLFGIVTVIEWTMHDLCELTTNKTYRDFFNLHRFGPLGLDKVVDKNKPWSENREELKHWIKLFLNWLESPLDQLARQLSEPD